MVYSTWALVDFTGYSELPVLECRLHASLTLSLGCLCFVFILCLTYLGCSCLTCMFWCDFPWGGGLTYLFFPPEFSEVVTNLTAAFSFPSFGRSCCWNPSASRVGEVCYQMMCGVVDKRGLGGGPYLGARDRPQQMAVPPELTCYLGT